VVQLESYGGNNNEYTGAVQKCTLGFLSFGPKMTASRSVRRFHYFAHWAVFDLGAWLADAAIQPLDNVHTRLS
jgi:hypothetical protein